MKSDTYSNLLIFLYNLQAKNISIWLDSNKLEIFSKNQLSDTTINYLKKNKSEIISILRHNKIFEEPNYPLIYSLPNNNTTPYPLSFSQERLFFINEFEGGTNAYNIPILLKLNSTIKLEVFIKNLQLIAKKHEILRTTFTEKDGDYFQEINNEKLIINNEQVKTEDKYNNFLKKSINHIFDLKNEYPIKADVIEYKNNVYASIVIHHIAFDGWSTDIFLNELTENYKNYCKGIEPSIEKNLIQYKDFALWQRQYLTGETLNSQLNYWKKHLKGFENLKLPTDKPRPKKASYKGDDYFLEIDKHLSDALRNIAKNKNTTLYNVLLSAFYILLNKYTNQCDIVIGTPAAGRNFKQIENTIGFFVNSLPLYLKFTDNSNINSLIEKVSKLSIEAQDHQDIPFEKLVEEINPEKDLSRHPIFQAMFNVQDFESIQNTDLYSTSDLYKYYKVAKFDLSLFIDDSREKINCAFNYATSLYNRDTIKRMADHYLNILRSIAENPKVKIKDISLLSEEEYQTIVYDWNKTEVPYPKEKTIHQLFEEQVEKTPNNTAVIFEDKKLTYKELNEKANQLAHTLKKEYKEFWSDEIKDDTLIGIYIERSMEMIVGILGILKAGAAYVPFDTNEPEERLKFKINDCGCKFIVTSSDTTKKLLFLADSDVSILSIDGYADVIEKTQKTNPKHINKSTDLAYVIYTSGSTGKPKGVMIEHKNVANLLISLSKIYPITKTYRKASFFTSYIFDVSVSEMFSCIIKGGELHIFSETLKKSPELLSNYILENKLNFIYFPPAILNLLPHIKYNSIKSLIFAGEPCDTDTGTLWSSKYNLYNYYGPTEATVYSTGRQVSSQTIKSIGSPLFNTACYILDSNLSPVPVGVPGELYIGGDGLARGYLNRPKLTEEKFISNPFATKQDRINNRNLRLYKTGDLVKYLSDGNIEFLGRTDNQIKIRGFRIELGEIESILNQHPTIKQSAVILKAKGTNKYLAAYYTVRTIDNRLQTVDHRLQTVDNRLQATGHRQKTTTNNEQQTTNNKHKTTNNDLREYLSNLLPDYMVPSVFVKLEKMPLNTNGKIDRKVLPDADLKADKDNYIPPSNETEKKLCKIWQEVLGIKKVGINDNFFQIGGNSILAIKLVLMINKTLSSNLTISSLFKFKNIKTISAFVLESEKKKKSIIDEGEI